MQARQGGAHRALAPLPRDARAQREGARELRGDRPGPHDRSRVLGAASHLRRGGGAQAHAHHPRDDGGQEGARRDQRGARPRLRRVGSRLLHHALRRADEARPHRLRGVRHGAVQLGALAPLVLLGPAGDRRGGAGEVALQAGQGDGGRPQGQRQLGNCLLRQLVRHQGLRDAGAAPLRGGRAVCAQADRRDLPPDPDGRDAQLPVRHRALPRRRDGHRRPHPRRAGHRPRRARDRGHLRLLRGLAPRARLRAAVGGQGRAVPVQHGDPAADRARGLQRRVRLWQQVRRACHPGLHPLVRHDAAHGRAAGVDQADHVHRGHRPDGRAPRQEGRGGEGDGHRQGGRACLPHRDGGGRGLVQARRGGGRQAGRAQLQRGAARRRGDGEQDEPHHPRVHQSGRGQPHPRHPRPGRRRQRQRAQGDLRADRRAHGRARYPLRRQVYVGTRDLGRRVPGEQRATHLTRQPASARAHRRARVGADSAPGRGNGRRARGALRLARRLHARRPVARARARRDAQEGLHRHARRAERHAARTAHERDSEGGGGPRAQAALRRLEALPDQQGRPLRLRADCAAAVRRAAAHATRRPCACGAGLRDAHRYRHHRRRAAHPRAGQPGGHGADDGGGGAHEHVLGAGDEPAGHQGLGQLDVGGQDEGRGRAHVRRVRGPARPARRAGCGNRRR
mmetsp:Transcript_14859/g.37604  ORF Transcript_14859/g.37604 Transcript_14859/m.37604 type:complete len:680 (-) Transcript_14859:1884-3923(-)